MLDKLHNSVNRAYHSDKLSWIIIGIGILLRLVRYLHNPSLNFDEAGNAVIIADSTFSDLTKISPDATLTYPFTFQFFTKLFIQIFGNSEYALRLYPLLFGIASLFLFYHVAKTYLSSKVLPAALLLFSVLNSVVYYSSIVKPYSSDVFFSLLIFSSLIYFQANNFDVLRTFLFAVLGGIVIWFSNPSVFVLAGVGTSLIIFSFIRKEWSRVGAFFFVSITWAGSFVCYYVMFLNNIMSHIGNNVDDIIQKEAAFFPFPPKSLGDIKWYMDTFFNTFNFVDTFDFKEGLTLTGIAALLFIAGCILMYSKNKERFFTLISPIFFTLLASAFHQYPFKGRLILFLTPFFLLVISEGIAFIHEKTKNSTKAITAMIVLFLFIYPLSWAAYDAVKPVSIEEIKPVLKDIKDNWQKGDTLYVHFFAQYAFDYYSQYHPDPFTFAKDEYIIGIAPRNWYREWKKGDVSKYYDTGNEITQTNTDILEGYIRDLNKLRGHKRVWLLFTGNVSSTKGIKDEDFFRFYMDTKGERLGFFQSAGAASAYLYNLRDNPAE